jgi:hypothetical protein
MPPTPASVVEQWMNLPRAVLQDKVRQVVKRRDADAKHIWAEVRGHAVLAAQVRGALSALRAEVRGTRDEVMWTMWIEQARAVLDPSQNSNGSADKAAAAKAAKPESEAPSKPAAKAQPTPEPAAADADPGAEISFSPQPAQKPRATPTVPPVMFQAPGS